MRNNRLVGFLSAWLIILPKFYDKTSHVYMQPCLQWRGFLHGPPRKLAKVTDLIKRIQAFTSGPSWIRTAAEQKLPSPCGSAASLREQMPFHSPVQWWSASWEHGAFQCPRSCRSLWRLLPNETFAQLTSDDWSLEIRKGVQPCWYGKAADQSVMTQAAEML